jgi:DNA-binding transcriptional MerR regulator
MERMQLISNTQEELDDVRFLTIGEVAPLINRSPVTIRAWDRKGLLPDHLRPARDRSNNRLWTFDQVAELADWADERELGTNGGDRQRKGIQERRHLERRVVELEQRMEVIEADLNRSRNERVVADG